MAKPIDEIYIVRIAEQLRKRRRESGFSLEDVSAMTGLTVNTISSIENGGDTYVSNCLAICQAIKLDPKDLFDLDLPLEPRFALPPDRKERLLTTRRVTELVESGFFASPRLVVSVLKEFSVNYGVEPPSSEVSTALKKLAKDGRLEYTKLGRKNVYREKT